MPSASHGTATGTFDSFGIEQIAVKMKTIMVAEISK